MQSEKTESDWNESDYNKNEKTGSNWNERDCNKSDWSESESGWSESEQRKSEQRKSYCLVASSLSNPAITTTFAVWMAPDILCSITSWTG